MIELEVSVKSEFVAHAMNDFPREACGLVAVVKGKQQYHPCKNLAHRDSDFLLSPEDYAVVEDYVTEYAGDIVAVLHSHPGADSRPTPADKVGCEASGLQWFIFSLKTKDWHTFSPSGYRAPLIGRKFKHGVFDCYSAVRDWYKEKLSISLPDFEREDKWWNKGQNLIMDNFQSAGFTQVSGKDLKVGDIILMNMAGPIVSHCAVYIGNDQIFHQTVNRLSSREIYGGIWKKNTRMVVRYSR
jgi:cell wall-associated NlpC family hydrolase